MACSSMDSKIRYQIRSCSLPSKFNPINQKIEQELKKLRTKEELSTSASETITIGITGLAELYGCINEVLGLPLTQQALSLHQHDKSVGDLLKSCSWLLSVCCTTREVVLKQRETAKTLESSLYKGKETAKVVSNVASYNSSRKEVITTAKNAILSLKQLTDDDRFEDGDYHLSTVIRALRCVSIISISVYESLLTFLSMPVSKPKRSLVSKLMNKRSEKSSDFTKSGNELNDVDVSLHSFSSTNKVDDDMFKLAQKRLNALESTMGGIENGLEGVCKQLTETRSCLMNIVSF